MTTDTMMQGVMLLSALVTPILRSIPKARYMVTALVITLCSQPCWVYTTYKNGDWGMCGATAWYAVWCIIGLYQWHKKSKEEGC